MPENVTAAAGGQNSGAPGPVDPALLARLNAASTAYTAAQGRRASLAEAVARTLQVYRTAAVNVVEVPASENAIAQTTTGATTRGQGVADAEKIAYEAALDALKRADEESDYWLKETARLTDEVSAQQGVSSQERASIAAAFEQQIAAGALANEASVTQNAVAALELEIAQAEQMAQGTPEEIKARQAVLDDLAVRKGAADIAQSEASARSSDANAALTAANTVTENALRPLLVQKEAGLAASAESQGIIDAANAKHADQLAQANADLQQKNVTWQEYQNRLANIDLEYKTALLAGGMPQIEVDQALATLKGTDIANQQLSEGEIVTKLTQWHEAIVNGKMTREQANQAVYDLQHGSTEMQRQQQVDANTQTAIQQAAAGGYLVGPGQTTTDHFGLLGSTFDSLGLSGQSKQPIHPQAPPEFLQSTGQMSTAQRTSDTFAPDGSYYGANGVPAFLDASKGLAMGPDEWEQMKGAEVVEKVEASAAAKAPEEAAAAQPGAPGEPSTPITVNVNVGGRQGGAGSGGLGGSSTAPTEAPVLPLPVMPPGGGGSGMPVPAPLPAAPYAGDPLAPPGTIVSAPPKGPDPTPRPTTGLPGMVPHAPEGAGYIAGMHKPTPGAAAPRQRPPAWLRSAPFAGGR